MGTSQGVQEVTPQQPTPDVQASPESTPATPVEGQQEQPGSKPSPRSGEQARLIGVIKGLQAELDGYKKGQPTTNSQPVQDQPKVDQTPPDYSGDKIYTHPAIKDLRRDGDGDVLYHGTYVSPEFAIQQEELRGRLAGFERWQAESTEKEYNARLEALQTELLGSVQTSIKELRAEKFPNIPKDRVERLDRRLLRDADVLLSQYLDEGQELSPELIDRVGREAINEYATDFGFQAEEQLLDNQRYREEHKVTPGGVPGTPAPKAPLTRNEQRRLQAQRSALVDARMRERQGL